MNVLRVSRSRPALSTACLSILLAAAPPAAASVTWDVDAAQEYCVSVGGQVQERQATWNTNGDPSQWVDLGRTMEVCRFKADDEAGSRIYVDLLTLWSEAPSLAAAAYLARVPMSDEPPAGNPASFYCADLGGSSQWGIGRSRWRLGQPRRPGRPGGGHVRLPGRLDHRRMGHRLSQRRRGPGRRPGATLPRGHLRPSRPSTPAGPQAPTSGRASYRSQCCSCGDATRTHGRRHGQMPPRRRRRRRRSPPHRAVSSR